MEQLSILRAFLVSEPTSVAAAAIATLAPDPLLLRRVALLEEQLEREKDAHAKALFTTSEKDHGQRVELEHMRLANAVLLKQTEEIPTLRLRLAEANEDARKRVERSEPTVAPPPAAVDALLLAMKKSCSDSEQLLADCCAQLRALQGDSEAANAEVAALRGACASSNAAGAQLVLTNATLRQRLSATLECQSAMATRASQQGAALAASEARLAEVTASLGLQCAQVGELSKRVATADASNASHTSSMLLLHESRITQEGALSRLRVESVALRERLRVHGDEASSAAAKHAAELRDRDAHASELAESLRDAREGSSALARALRASGAKVEALQVQLSEAELARSKLVVQLCDAEQRGDAPLPPAALPPPLAAAMTQALSFGPPAATEPQPEVLPDEGAGEQLSRGALQLPQGAGGSSAQPLLPLPLPARGRERGSIVEEGSSAAALLPGMNPDSRVLDHLQTSSPAPVAGAATGAAKSPPALMRGRSTPGAVGPVAAAAAAKPSFMPGSEEALACDALASLLGEA